MNDEQCQALIDAIGLLTGAIREGSESIMEAIESIYTPDNGGIERGLERIIDILGTFVDIVDRRM